MRILLVEDDAIIAMAAEATLITAGHEVMGPICDVERAVELARDTGFDLALVDINLAGGEEGVGVARRLQALGLGCIFTTGQPAIARDNKDAALGVLEKPYSDAALRETIPVIATLLDGGSPPPPSIPAGLELFR